MFVSETSDSAVSRPNKRTLTDAALDGVRWNYAGFLSRGAAGLVVGSVLARLLGPKPFGRIGVASIIFGLGTLLADAGFSSALVQAVELRDVQIRFVFTMQVLFGGAMTAIMWLIAPAVGSAVHDPGVIAVVRAVSPIFILQSLGQTATGLLKRNLRFRPIQAAQISSYLLGYAGVGLTMACTGFGVWSLVAAQLAQPLLYSLMVYAVTTHSVRPYINGSGLQLLRFGSQVTGANLINWTIVNLDNILVGKTFGSEALGLYSRSFNLAIVPVEAFVNSCQQVLFASCSRVEQQFDRMRRAYLATVGAVALFTLPTFWSMAVSARFVIGGLYGPHWNEAVPLFTSFAIAMPFFALMAIAGPVLGAADRVNQEIRTQGVSMLVTLLAFIAASHISLLAVACVVPPVYAFRFWYATRPALRLLGLRWRDLIPVIAGPAVAAAFTTGCVFAASQVADNPNAPALMLAKLAVAGVLSLLVALYVGRQRVLPAALINPLFGRTTNLPRWATRLLQPLAGPPNLMHANRVPGDLD